MKMDEYIRKDKAIDIFIEGDGDDEFTEGYNFAVNEYREKIRAIPAADVQPVKHGRWITKAEEYYKAWQDSGRSWNDMPYFVTGLKFACSNCFEQFDVNAEGVEKWNGCPLCLARMDGDTE
jgi:hypothetical protein